MCNFNWSSARLYDRSSHFPFAPNEEPRVVLPRPENSGLHKNLAAIRTGGKAGNKEPAGRREGFASQIFCRPLIGLNGPWHTCVSVYGTAHAGGEKVSHASSSRARACVVVASPRFSGSLSSAIALNSLIFSRWVCCFLLFIFFFFVFLVAAIFRAR